MSLSVSNKTLLLLPVLWLVGCTDPAPETQMEPPPVPPSPDLSLVQDMSQPLGPDLLARCELPYDVRNIDKVSTGTVTVMTAPSDPMVFTAEVDATAGGSMKYGENPFVYLDLIGRKKVDITDVQSPNQGGWDIALKRWQLKINSGDSGNGGVTVAIVDGKNLADVTKPPAGPYEADAYFDGNARSKPIRLGGWELRCPTGTTTKVGQAASFPKKKSSC